MAVADAVGQAVVEALTELSHRLEPGEVPVDLAHVERYKVGPRGLRVTLDMLVATNRRLWHLVHRDGAPAPPVPIPMDAVTTRRKGLLPSMAVERSGTGWVVTATKPIATWVEETVRSRPQTPVGLVAKLAPAGVPGAPPASWMADPRGRYELRWWDGSRWTEHVFDRGVAGQDPVG